MQEVLIRIRSKHDIKIDFHLERGVGVGALINQEFVLTAAHIFDLKTSTGRHMVRSYQYVYVAINIFL